MSAGGGCLSLYIRRRRVASRSARRAVYNETQLWRRIPDPSGHSSVCMPRRRRASSRPAPVGRLLVIASRAVAEFCGGCPVSVEDTTISHIQYIGLRCEPGPLVV